MQLKNKKRIRGGLKSPTLFGQILSLGNLRRAFDNFKHGKTKKPDVIIFSENHVKEIYRLYDQLRRKTYSHRPYEHFYVRDPKLRSINKASVRDRVVHHAIFSKLYLMFDRSFIYDSYSCRIEKGTHRAVRRLHEFFRKESRNNTRDCWVLKCDVRKFFDNINQGILLLLIKRRVKDEHVLWLISVILKSFPKGLPLGNITSQLFANVYLNELDQYIKHVLKVSYYIRYCDDFVILSHEKPFLEKLIPVIDGFLQNYLKLVLHPNKILIRKYSQGIDFLGYVSFPSHAILRVKTKKRMFRNIALKLQKYKEGKTSKESFLQTLNSYLGMLKHCKAHSLKSELQTMVNERP